MSTIFRKHIYQDQTGGDGGGGGGAPAIEPAAAREFVSQFVHDPKALEGMKDADVLGYHGRVTQALEKVRPAGAFPEKWREELAKGADGKPVDAVVKRLSRYTTPKAAIEALVSVQERISAGELRSQLPKDATPAQVTAWRAENNIPETADKYDIKLPEGITIGERDKPIIDALFAEMHPAGLSNAMASKFVESYYKVLEKQAAAGAQALADKKKGVEDGLRTAWGTDYRANQNLIQAVINEKVPAGSPLAKRIQGALETDGEFAEFMAGIARTINPVTTLIPGSDSANISQGIDSEIKVIEAEMKKNGRENLYYKGPIVDKGGHKDTEMAHRYRELLEARERAKGK